MLLLLSLLLILLLPVRYLRMVCPGHSLLLLLLLLNGYVFTVPADAPFTVGETTRFPPARRLAYTHPAV